MSILVPSPIDRIVHRAAVDRRVRADLNIILDDDAADLDDLDHAAPRPRRVAETVLADTRTGMDDYIVADKRAKHAGASSDRAIAADSDSRTDDGPGADSRALHRFRRRRRSPP